METTPVQASPHDFVVLPCRVRRGKDLVWVRCNTESEKTELLIFKSGHLNEAGGLLVRSNGSLILPDAREGVTSEYRCYRVHGNSRILRSRFNLSVKGIVHTFQQDYMPQAYLNLIVLRDYIWAQYTQLLHRRVDNRIISCLRHIPDKYRKNRLIPNHINTLKGKTHCP